MASAGLVDESGVHEILSDSGDRARGHAAALVPPQALRLGTCPDQLAASTVLPNQGFHPHQSDLHLAPSRLLDLGVPLGLPRGRPHTQVLGGPGGRDVDAVLLEPGCDLLGDPLPVEDDGALAGDGQAEFASTCGHELAHGVADLDALGRRALDDRGQVVDERLDREEPRRNSLGLSKFGMLKDAI